MVNMNEARLMRVLLAPYVSEKSATIADKNNQVVFRVIKDAAKQEIKNAVELLFDVKVQSVTVANIKGKTKRFGVTRGRRSDWKKAYVALENGYEIDFLGSE